MLSTEWGTRFPTYAPANISCRQKNIGSPLSASIHRTLTVSIPSARSDMPVCCGVLVLAFSSNIPVWLHRSLKSLPMNSPPILTLNRSRRAPLGTTIDCTNGCASWPLELGVCA